MTLFLFTLLAFTMTFVGGLVPAAQKLLSRAGLSRLFSVRAGILLAVALTEILPEAWELNRAMAGWAAVGAFLLLFALANYAMLDTCGEYMEQCRVHYLGWTALLALSTHSFIDGFNLAVSFSAGAKAGAAVGLALALHKIADGFTLVSLFGQAKFTRKKTLALLVLVALATPLGSLLSSPALGFGVSSLPSWLEALLLGFAAGSFIYVAATDVLPRMHREGDRQGVLYFAAGLIGMGALRLL
jgi:zinc and cadmium transporter